MYVGMYCDYPKGIEVEFDELIAVFTINNQPLANYFETKEEIINCFKAFPINEIEDENVRAVIVNFTKEFFAIDGNKVSIVGFFTDYSGKNQVSCLTLNFESNFEFYEGSPQTETSPEEPPSVDVYIKDGDINDNLKRISKEVCDFLQKQDVFSDKLINFEIEEIAIDEDELYEKVCDEWLEEHYS